jgi:hypothetical protein
MGITFYRRRRKMLEKLEDAKAQVKELDEKADSFLMKLVQSPWTGAIIGGALFLFALAVLS